MTELGPCPALEADGRWCEFVGDNGGPHLCVWCGRDLAASGSEQRDEAPETGSPKRCRPCGRPCHNGLGVHDCCERLWNGRYCPSCEASDRFWREDGERRSRPRRRRQPTHKKKERTP